LLFDGIEGGNGLGQAIDETHAERILAAFAQP
jgi:hypothetical protein